MKSQSFAKITMQVFVNLNRLYDRAVPTHYTKYVIGCTAIPSQVNVGLVTFNLRGVTQLAWAMDVMRYHHLSRDPRFIYRTMMQCHLGNSCNV